MNKRIIVGLLILTMITSIMTGCKKDGNTDVNVPKDNTPKKKEQMYFATGTPGGVYQMLGTGMAKIINENIDGIELVATTPAQIAQAPAMIQNKEAMLGIGMACMFSRAVDGIDEFEGDPHTDLVQIMGMYDNVMSFVVLGNSPMNSINDINEKTVIGSTATNVILTKALIKEMGTVDPEKLDFRVMSYQQGAEALGDGSIDMVILTGYPKNGTLDSIATLKGAKLLEIDDDTRAKFDKTNVKWKMNMVPAGTYKGQDKDSWGPTIYTVLYGHRDLSEELVYNIIKTTIDNVEELTLIHPAGSGIVNETTSRYINDGIMEESEMHPGAVKYFKEIGAIK